MPRSYAKDAYKADCGRLGGLIGGVACWADISAEERRIRMTWVASKRWAGVPHAKRRAHAMMMVKARRRERESS